MVMQEERTHLQGDPSGWLKPPFDLVPTVLAAGWPLLQLATAQAGQRNIPNWSQQEVLQILLCHPVDCSPCELFYDQEDGHRGPVEHVVDDGAGEGAPEALPVADLTHAHQSVGYGCP